MKKDASPLRIVELWGFSNLEDSEGISEFYIAAQK